MKGRRSRRWKRAYADGRGQNCQRAADLVAGPVTFTAHGETVTLHDPVTITARTGVLVIAVTLPVESYVERVVASESGAADSTESLKALAIVVRSFALHEAHGHTDFDLCDSTHCQLLHWGGNGERTAAAHAAALATAGETLWFHGQRALAYFREGLRRADGFANRNLAACQASSLSAVAARSILHSGWRQRVGVGDFAR